MNSPVFTSLFPVILFIAIGFYVGRRGWIRAGSVKDLANLVFMVLTPALLFRTMSTVHIQDLDFGPVAIYFVAFAVVYAATLAVLGFTSLGAARALANTFSNTLMIGVPLVGLVFGDAGLVTLFTLISVHSLILLTAATVVFELASAREHAGREGAAQQPMWRTVLQAMRNGIVHPVPLPIIAGLLHGYIKTLALSEHAKEYGRMQVLYAHAERAMAEFLHAGDLQKCRALVLELGIEALAENADWVLLHRDRPLPAPAL